MAKRYGNYYTLRDLLAKGCNPRAIRLLLLSTHYRQQFNFTFSALDAAKSAIERVENLLRRLKDVRSTKSLGRATDLTKEFQNKFGDSMDDDLNVSLALASFFDFVRDLNNLIDVNGLSTEEAKRIETLLTDLDRVLGILGEEEEENLPQKVQELLNKREEARKNKNWKTSDELRNQLREMGYLIEDTAQGTRLRREKD